MVMLTDQSYGALIALALLVFFNCVQRCQVFVTAVASECGTVVSPIFGRRLGSPPREQQLRTSYLSADAGPCIAE
jgi:hypothetical protein